jgi:hypothetical protein
MTPDRATWVVSPFESAGPEDEQRQLEEENAKVGMRKGIARPKRGSQRASVPVTCTLTAWLVTPQRKEHSRWPGAQHVRKTAAPRSGEAQTTAPR